MILIIRARTRQRAGLYLRILLVLALLAFVLIQLLGYMHSRDMAERTGQERSPSGYPMRVERVEESGLPTGSGDLLKEFMPKAGFSPGTK